MAAVTYSYYTDVFLGDAVAASDFPKYEKRAEDIINTVVRGVDVSTLPADVQDAYKAAICYQVDYYSEVGLTTAVTGSAANSYTLGKVRVENGAAYKGARAMISPAAISILELSGLLYRGIPVKGAWNW